MSGSAARVAHVIETAFERTETFIYEQVIAAMPFEAWCLAWRRANEMEIPFDRVLSCGIRWAGWQPWDLVDRVWWKVRHDHQLPLGRSLRRLRPVLVHAHFGHIGWRVLQTVKARHLPVITSFYGRDASSLPLERGWMPRLHRLFGEGAAFLVEGPAMKARLQRLGCPELKIRIVPLLIPAARYSYRRRIFLPGSRLRVLFVGRFVPKKGLDVLLRALARARGDLPAFELVTVGSGTPEAEGELLRLVSELELDGCVSFRGSQPRREVIAELERAHILAAPSLTAPDGDTEGGAPTVLLEAQASGLPILSTRHADIPFATAGAFHEFLACEGDVEDLAKKMVALVQATPRWPELGLEGRRHVEEQHGWYARDQLIQAYRSAVR